MDTYASIASAIIRHQGMIMGKLALSQAQGVSGLEIKDQDHLVINGDPKKILRDLVLRYASIFGNTSVDECRDALNDLKPRPPDESLPDILKSH